MSKLMLLAGPAAVVFFSAPLAIFATLTTILAVNVLLLRYIIVCFDFAAAFARAFLFDNPLPDPSVGQSRSPPGLLLKTDPPSRNTLTIEAPNSPIRTKTRSFASLNAMSGSYRDYESVGGWRLAFDEEDDAAWTGLNSRLELPAISGERQRHHRRRHSSQSMKLNRTITTPMARTPPAADPSVAAIDGYFSFTPHETVPMSPEEFAAKSRMDERTRIMRRSSQSSGSSVPPSKSSQG